MFPKESHGPISSLENAKRKSERAQAKTLISTSEYQIEYAEKYQFYPRPYAEPTYMMELSSKPTTQIKESSKIKRITRENASNTNNNENYNPNERKTLVRNPFLQGGDHHSSIQNNRTSAAMYSRAKQEVKDISARADKLYQISSKFQTDEPEDDKVSVNTQITTKKSVKSKALKKKDASKTKIKIDKKIKVFFYFYFDFLGN